jgi:hypothetical protein
MFLLLLSCAENNAEKTSSQPVDSAPLSTESIQSISSDQLDSLITKGNEDKSAKSLPSENKSNFTYSVDRQSQAPTYWVVKVNQISRIRWHTSRAYYPYHEALYVPGSQQILLARQQWLEAQVFGTEWSVMSDADRSNE